MVDRPADSFRPRAWVSVLALLLLMTPARAQDVPDGMEFVTTVEGISEYRLENGLRVLLFPDPSKPQITVNVTYFVGSRHEGYGETGMAHLLEHLVFKGTPDHTDIMQELTERGAQPNGTTNYDRTNYFEIFPASDENLEWALDLESDRMVNSFIAKEDLDSEMTVVRNEMEAGENSPFRILMERVLSTAYLWHNYGKSTIGARADVENVPIERLQAFYRKYYQPDNAMLVVAGNFDGARALDLIHRKFGALPRPERTGSNILYPTYTVEPTQDGERTVSLRRAGDVQIVMSSHHVPPGSHPDYAAVDVLAFVLGDTPSGRLYKALVETNLASQAGAFAYQLREAGPLLSFAEVRKEGDVEAVRTTLGRTVQDVLQTPVTDEEVARAKAALLKQVELSFNNSMGIALQLSEWAAMGDWRLFFLHRDRIEAVTPGDVNRVAALYLKPDNRTVGVFHPTEDPDRAEIPGMPDVDGMVSGYTGGEAVAEGEAFDPSPANVDARTSTFTLANGMEVALVPKETRGDAVTVRLRLQFGDEESLRGRATAGSMAGNMLMRGTEIRTRQELEDELDRLKASGGIGGGAALGTGQITTVRESVADVIRIMAEVVRQPSFPGAEFATLKEQRLASLEEQRSDPFALAQIALARHMDPRPADHPGYTGTVEEEIAALQDVGLEDVTAFYRDFYGPQSGNLVVVGDFDPDELRAVIEDAFGDWTSPHAFTRIATPFREITAENLSIETPDKANAIFLAQQNLELSDGDADYPALVLAGYMIGGGVLNSRLARRIRVQDGLSYGAGGAINGHPVDPVGQFTAYAIYAPENASAVEAAFREEIEKVLADGFTEDEMATSKQGWLEGRQLNRAQDASLAGQISSNLYFDRTFAEAAELEDAVRALTLDEVNAAVRRSLDLAKITIVKAGDFAGAAEKKPIS
ncbi:MAG: insulinase family protein [Gemmatimonadota bacterium]|nr:insulinase family protein [Gemmatimonadota bacterium]MDH5758973.1 insulinase family protein [Gemmatimonadota bacterium]